MRLLLDTHVLLWAADETSGRLSEQTLQMINDPDNIIYVSNATLWELGIKSNVGKLNLPDEFFDSLVDCGYEILNISITHIKIYISLPLHHRDPFDRILVSQAIAEQLTIVTGDQEISKYSVSTSLVYA